MATIENFFKSVESWKSWMAEQQCSVSAGSVDWQNQLARGLEFGNLLLEKRQEVEVWLKSRATTHGERRAPDPCLRSGPGDWQVLGSHETVDRNMSVVESDWPDLLEQFAPRLKDERFPDNGDLLCALSSVLDELALGRQVRMYVY